MKKLRDSKEINEVQELIETEKTMKLKNRWQAKYLHEFREIEKVMKLYKLNQ